MEKLTRWTNVRTDDLCRVEDPFFSTGIIRDYGDFLINTVSAMSGPGKWKITSIRVNKPASSAAFVANFLTSRGDEGRVFLSSGKDFANTTRTVTQEWVPLDEEEQYFSPSSAIHRYGMERKVTQVYVEADDAWDVSGTSWHWRPIIANEEYELKDKCAGASV
ncbi:hypothetical protein LJD21_04000 [Pseudomonas inefficax]|uniref:hypothetical protein n=1 Tax=Pseudomonas inefficax TaxID=2078786 RepID=UPI00207BACA2|nr:hypothetical protein [Pseudomonas inefficax]MCM8911333.1 hypothetical protein [Pseudomonas inefficax]